MLGERSDNGTSRPVIVERGEVQLPVWDMYTVCMAMRTELMLVRLGKEMIIKEMNQI